jgi:exodeoxyribonuclease VII large subunit
VADVRAPTPSAAAEIVLAAKDEFHGRIDRQTRRLRASIAAGLERRRTRVHLLSSRRGLAGFPARMALRGRHAAELTHHLQHAMNGALSRDERRFRTLSSRLEAHDLKRRLAAIRGQLAAAAGRLAASIRRRYDRGQAQLGARAARLETLSPLAVLGRGYAVCWNEDRTAIIRRANEVAPGDRVQVDLLEGRLVCDVHEAHGTSWSSPDGVPKTP